MPTSKRSKLIPRRCRDATPPRVSDLRLDEPAVMRRSPSGSVLAPWSPPSLSIVRLGTGGPIEGSGLSERTSGCVVSVPHNRIASG